MEVIIRSKPAPAQRKNMRKSFRFLDLPAELRNRIYEIALAEEKHGRVIVMRHFWYLPPSKLYKNKAFAGLTQVNRTIRGEFPPQQYHALYLPDVDFCEWSKFLKAFPFRASNLGPSIPALLTSLELGSAAGVDILPLNRIDWAVQPFTIFWRPNVAQPSNRALHVASCLMKFMERHPRDWQCFASITVLKAVGLVSVTLELEGVMQKQADLDARSAIIDRLIGRSDIMRFSDVQVRCDWGEFSFRAVGQKQTMCARGAWTKFNRKYGADHYY